jgi:hypothetical protein
MQQLPTDARGLRGSRRKTGLDHCLTAEEVMETEGEPAAKSLQDDVGDAIARHDCQHRLFERDRDVPSQGRANLTPGQPIGANESPLSPHFDDRQSV